MTAAFGAAEWLQLFGYYAALSMLTVGGAIAAAPDMHRFLVAEHGWLTDPQFAASIAIAQAAPGPNVLFVALLGWNVGTNAAAIQGGAPWTGYAAGLLGVAVTMVAILLPSTTLAWAASRWAHRNRERRAVRAFKQGMAPIVVGLLLATAWVLARAHGEPATDWRLWLLSAATAVLVWRTRLHLLWLLGAGAAAGVLGWV